MSIASGHVLVREATEDTVLEIPKPHGQVGTTTIPVPKGVQVSLAITKNLFLNVDLLCLQVIIDMIGVRTFFIYIIVPHTRL